MKLSHPVVLLWHRMCVELALAIEQREWDSMVRSARDAESAHLEAVLKVDGARYLRLAHLRLRLAEAVPARKDMLDLRAEPGDAPQLWLDAAHRVMVPDNARSYRLEHVGAQAMQPLFESADIEQAVQACTKVLAHAEIQEQRRAASPLAPSRVATSWPLATLLYVWLTGAITGIAAWILLSIYWKKFDFLSVFHRYIW
jgi:hypothetical protein